MHQKPRKGRRCLCLCCKFMMYCQIFASGKNCFTRVHKLHLVCINSMLRISLFEPFATVLVDTTSLHHHVLGVGLLHPPWTVITNNLKLSHTLKGLRSTSHSAMLEEPIATVTTEISSLSYHVAPPTTPPPSSASSFSSAEC